MPETCVWSTIVQPFGAQIELFCVTLFPCPVIVASRKSPLFVLSGSPGEMLDVLLRASVLESPESPELGPPPIPLVAVVELPRTTPTPEVLTAGCEFP